LFLLVESRQKGLKSVNMKMMMFVFIIKLGFPVMAIIVSYEVQSTPFPWSIKVSVQKYAQVHAIWGEALGDVAQRHACCWVCS
jgi:hypothetical protein